MTETTQIGEEIFVKLEWVAESCRATAFWHPGMCRQHDIALRRATVSLTPDVKTIARAQGVPEDIGPAHRMLTSAITAAGVSDCMAKSTAVASHTD